MITYLIYLLSLNIRTCYLINAGDRGYIFRCQSTFRIWFVHMYFIVYMGVDYVVVGFDMEVQPFVTHNAPFCVSAVCIDVVRNHLLFVHMS